MLCFLIQDLSVVFATGDLFLFLLFEMYDLLLFQDIIVFAF